MRPCPICAYNNSELLYTTPIKQTINLCSSCGMVFSEGLPSMDYANNSIYTSVATYPSQQGHYEQIVKNCEVKEGSVILDVGCAVGGLMKAFISAGYEQVYGISISSSEVECCIKQGLSATVCDVAHPLLQEHFDLVTLSHVLEHVSDPLIFLQNLRHWIKPTGIAYIEVPNALHYATHFTSVCQGFNSEHINHFDLSCLKLIMEKAGFSCSHSGEYITEDGYPCVWVTAQRVKNPQMANNPPLRTAIESYCEKLKEQIEQVTQHLCKELEGIEEFTIWGMGETTRMLLADGTIPANRVISAVDTNPVYHGKTIQGIPVCSPEEFSPLSYPILVCSQTHQSEIITRIRELGLTNRVITLSGRESMLPVECLKCGSPTGPKCEVGEDHAGWICPTCYNKLQD
jgi:SAM-dependent methyltransferase